jgi:hypothetical protein
MMAACWTGLRVNRGHGSCADGMTTCAVSGAQTQWGACTGEVLPVGTTGKAACNCFSTGQWLISNTEPCFLTVTDGQGNMTTTAYASTPGNPVSCPFDGTTGAPTVPVDWSTDTLEVDCTGTFTLCYTIKAGDGRHPQPTDCTLAKTCTTGHYGQAKVTQTLPPLPGWQTDPSAGACVAQFLAMGGYGEMSVAGQSDECAFVSGVFQEVTYCPTACNGSDAGLCGACIAGGGGSF